MNDQNSMRWIPVTERLPENDKRVLAYGKDHIIHDMKWSWPQDEWFDKISGGRYFESFVTHWMPLPKPPRSPESPEVVFTNADRVRKMSDEEMAKFMLSHNGAAYCKNDDRDSTCYLKNRDGMTACELCALDWLRKEAMKDE